MRNLRLLLTLGLWGCTPLEPADDIPGIDTPLPRGDSGLAPDMHLQCKPLADRRVEPIGGGEDGVTIAVDTTWTCERSYLLDGPVVVASGVTLTVGAGTRVTARPGALLLVAAGGRLEVAGEADAPVVFTAEGQAGRAPGSWRGVVLLSADDTNLGSGARVPQTLDDDDPRGLFGDSWLGRGEYCGKLSYMRVEFAGGTSPADGVPLGGLTFAGCGSTTKVDHVQVHRSTEGVAIYGGDVTLRHVLVTGSKRDGVEWTGGYDGTLQHLVVQQPSGSGSAISGYTRAEDGGARPRSAPTVVNATLVQQPGDGDEQTGVRLSQGSHLTLAASLITGFSRYAIDVTGLVDEPEGLTVVGSVFHDNGAGDDGDFPDDGRERGDDRVDDGGFDERAHFAPSEAGHVFDDPELVDPGSTDAPDFRPQSEVVEETSFEVLEDFEPTGYAGAFAVASGNARSWMSGWVDFPTE